MQKNSLGNIFKLGFLYLSTIIGAGFATGREIRVYFTDYGVSGFLGMAIATILLIFAGCAITIIVFQKNTTTVNEFNEIIAGKYVGKVITYVITSFSYCIYVIILAGLADLCERLFGIYKIYTVLFVSLVSVLVHICGFRVLAYVCSLTAPVITICVFIVAFFSLKTDFSIGEISIYPMSIFSGILYSGYNSLVAVSVMSRAIHLIDSKKTAVWGVIIGTLIIMACAFFVNLSLFMSYVNIKYSEMPLLTLVELSLGRWAHVLFIGMLLGTMITSAISGLSSVIHAMGNKVGGVLVCASVPLSFIGFGKLMDLLYPLYGVAGIFVLVMLVFALKLFYNEVSIIKDDLSGKQKSRYKLRTTKKKKDKTAIYGPGRYVANSGYRYNNNDNRYI